jgi:hypothetical protein
MKCQRCFKTCSKIEVEVFGHCGRCEAQDRRKKNES